MNNDVVTNEPSPQTQSNQAARTVVNMREVNTTGGRWGVAAAVVLSAGALGVSAWQWSQTQTHALQMTQAAATQMQQVESALTAQRELREQVASRLNAADGRFNDIQQRLTLATQQFEAIESMYQTLSHVQEEWRLSEFEHAFSIATQQLYLGGNIEGAIKALEVVEARLKHETSPRFASLRMAVHHDLERLRAAPTLNMMNVTVTLERLAEEGDELPLVVDVRRQVAAEAGSIEKTSWTQETDIWRRVQVLFAEIREEFFRAIQVQRLDRPDAALLLPEQAYFLRQNVRMRLLDARISMLQRDESAFRYALKTAREYVEQHCDLNQNSVQTWLEQVSLLEKERVLSPDLNILTSLEALRVLRAVRPDSVLAQPFALSGLPTVEAHVPSTHPESVVEPDLTTEQDAAQETQKMTAGNDATLTPDSQTTSETPAGETP